MSLKLSPLIAPILLACLPFAAVSQDHDHHAHDHAGHAHGSASDGSHQAAVSQDGRASAGEARAVMKPTRGSKTRGEIRFSMLDDGKIRIHGELTGLTASSSHGFHVHEKGDCSAPDASSAGGHFHLPGQQHGGPAFDDNHHAGDLGNIRTDDKGVARVDMTLPQKQLTLADEPQNIIGRGLIVHVRADDLHSQPTGDAGGRLACGVIQVVK